MSAIATDLALDILDDDLVIANGDLTINAGLDAYRQTVNQHLNFFTDEWFLDTAVGIPMRTQVLGKPRGKAPSPPAVREIFRQEILGCPGTLDVTSIAAVYDAAHRTFALNFTSESDAGTLTSTTTAGT